MEEISSSTKCWAQQNCKNGYRSKVYARGGNTVTKTRCGRHDEEIREKDSEISAIANSKLDRRVTIVHSPRLCVGKILR